MPTFNQLSSRVASIIKQPFNHELKERIKDSFKHIYATSIRQSVERNGIDSILKTSYIVEITPCTYITDKLEEITGNYIPIEDELPLFRSINKILSPIRILNDAPFTKVGNNIPIPYRTKSEIHIMDKNNMYNPPLAYYIENGYLYIVSTQIGKSVKDKYITIESIFEDPEQVINYYNDEDWDDTIIPIPNDMIETIIVEMLKSEFGIVKQENPAVNIIDEK